MVTVTATLAELARRDVTLSLTPDGRLHTDAPRGAITAELADAIHAHKWLLVWAVTGRRACQITASRTVQHRWAPCTACGREAMVATPGPSPKCRMTFGCSGRHTPPGAP